MAARRAIITVLSALLAALGLVGCGGGGGPAAQRRSVPQGFLGMMVDGPVVHPQFARRQIDLDRELGSIAASGVEAVRVNFDWATIQPYRSFAAVAAAERRRYLDVGGVPTDLRGLDRIVRLAARHGMRVLALVDHAPRWARAYPDQEWSPPADPGSYARLAAALVARYGPHGSLRGGLPIRQWAIWNEPEQHFFWSDARGRPAGLARYVRMLRAAHAAIKRVDPGAQVVLAGLASEGPQSTSWAHLATLYRLGARPYFDAVAIHPYTYLVGNVVRTLVYARAVMRRNGDARKPILVTELSWPSARTPAGAHLTTRRYGFETDERGQARRIAAALPRLAALRRRLGIGSVYWYTWMTLDRGGEDPFGYAGLRVFALPSGRVRSKPGLAAWTAASRRLEGCVKTAAGRCG